ncbi:MAG: hypothetical protein OHK0053_28040 [Microscillaceae bacterium]
MAEGFALVELFTSEGCSSCPPADKVATQMARQADSTGAPVYVLAYHVDYWNRLGWHDRFSAPEFSARQNWYAQIWQSSQVYTPQMVVNGSVEFVGSNPSLAEKHVAEARQKTGPLPQLLRLEAGEKINYYLEKIPASSVLHLAWVQKDLHTEVKAGENRGRHLYHYSVVRALQTLASPQVKGAFSAPSWAKEGHFELVAFLQNAQTGQILAAQKLSLNASK